MAEEDETTPNPFYIASELLEEIFARLPLKSVLRFKTVSKECRSILESKSFTEKHLRIQKSGKTRRKILAAYDCDCGGPPSLFHNSRFEGSDEIVYLHCDASRPSMSCDGFVCIPEPGSVNVLNPSTGQLWRFPSGPDPAPTPINRRVYCIIWNGAWSRLFPGCWSMGFGRDKVNGSYKVVRMFFDPSHCEILDVEIGEWRKLSPPPYEVEAGRRSACVNGTIYWLEIWRVCRVLALDLHTEEFHDVPLHKGISIHRESQILNLEDHLAIATGRVKNYEWELEIWFMDAQEKWTKTYSISLASLGIKPYELRWYTPVTVSELGNLVFHDNKNRLFRYCKRTNTIRQISPNTLVISPYIENLVRLQNEQVQLRTEISCIRGKSCIIKDGFALAQVVSTFQSRVVNKFLLKGKKYLSVLLWRRKMKLVATYLFVHLLCSGDTVTCAAKLIFINWLGFLGVWGNIIKVMVIVFLLELVGWCFLA